MLDSNQRRLSPHGLANRCINHSANLPIPGFRTREPIVSQPKYPNAGDESATPPKECELLSLPFAFPQFTSRRERAGVIPIFHNRIETFLNSILSVFQVGQQPNGNNRIRTDNTTLFRRVLYQLELCSRFQFLLRCSLPNWQPSGQRR